MNDNFYIHQDAMILKNDNSEPRKIYKIEINVPPMTDEEVDAYIASIKQSFIKGTPLPKRTKKQNIFQRLKKFFFK